MPRKALGCDLAQKQSKVRRCSLSPKPFEERRRFARLWGRGSRQAFTISWANRAIGSPDQRPGAAVVLRDSHHIRPDRKPVGSGHSIPIPEAPMRKLVLIAAMLMASASAHAGNFSFNVEGQKVQVQIPRGCSSLSCINI